jgi:hypothetical protein
MDAKKFSEIFFKSLNPFRYKELITQRKRDVISYFFSLLFFAILLGWIFSIPTLGYLPQKIDDSLAKFTKFTVTGIEVETNETIMLLKSPRVVLDFRAVPESHDAFLVITSQDIYLRKLSPDFLQLKLYNTTKIPVEQYSDLLADFNSMKKGIWIFLFFMLPSIFFFVYVLNLIKFAAILAVSYVAALVYRALARKSLNLEVLLKVTIFSSGIMIFSDIALAPFVDLGFLPIVLFLIYFTIAQNIRVPKKKQTVDDEEYVTLGEE